MNSSSSRHAIQYGNTTIEYTLTYRDREKLAIHVHPDAQVSVEAPPGTDLSLIEERVHKRAAWILKQQWDFQRYSFEIPPRQYVSGESYRYLGRQYILKVISDKKSVSSVHMDRERILVYTSDTQNRAKVKKLVNDWYRAHARKVFAERVEQWYPRFVRFGITQPKVVVRQMKTRWGSCTAAGKITLNLKLIQVPKQYIDYVIVHELCHLIQPNHSSDFYTHISRIMPDWKERREELNMFEF